MRTLLRYGLLVMISASLAGGCAGKSKFQGKMKGLWVLKSRSLPSGIKISPPQISGRMEWFPMDVDAETAHVSILTTHGNTVVQVLGTHYDIEGQDRFAAESYLEIGGGLNKTASMDFVVAKSPDSGSITVEGPKITFQHQKGYTFIFNGSELTIRHQDGTTDILQK